MEVGLGPDDLVLDGTQLPPKTEAVKEGTAAPQFSALVYCGQTAGWINMPLGREVGLGHGHSARWGPSSPPTTGVQLSIIGACLLWPNSRLPQLLLITCIVWVSDVLFFSFCLFILFLFLRLRCMVHNFHLNPFENPHIRMPILYQWRITDTSVDEGWQCAVCGIPEQSVG